MSDYTPTTEEVRQNWQGYGYIRDSQLGRIKGEDFDRWLAEVKAQAWEEGMMAFDFAVVQDKGEGDPRHHLTDNPYRQGEEQ